MSDIETIRLNQLVLLVQKYENNQKKLAEALDLTPGYINQLLGRVRPITEKSARKFERKLGLDNGWFDNPITGTFKATEAPDRVQMTGNADPRMASLQAVRNKATPHTDAMIATLITAIQNKTLTEEDAASIEHILKRLGGRNGTGAD